MGTSASAIFSSWAGGDTASCMSAMRPLSRSSVRRKRVPKHRLSTFGLLPCRFVLNDIPVLDQHAIFDAKDVRCNPVHGLPEAGKSPVDDHQVVLGHNHARFILERGRHGLD